MRVIHLARKPLSENSVAANVLKHGTGALNIDACRISTSDNLNGGAYAQDGSERWDGAENWRFKREGGAGEFAQPAGRWPSNLILQHLDGCQPVRGFSDADGMETVDAWECVAGCPVAGLDEQSGITVSKKGTPRGSGGHGEGWGMTATGAEYDDTGGVSRFFKQVGVLKP